MNRNQYFATGWFFLVSGTLLYLYDWIFIKPLLFSTSAGWAITNSLAPSSYYIITKSAIESSIIGIYTSLAILFFILGYLEKKK